jgi:uncharacterized protein (TIGR03435 family)
MDSAERFDIAAKVLAGATKEQFNLMLQNLLTERFQIVVHREEREVAGYAHRSGESRTFIRRMKTGSLPNSSVMPRFSDSSPGEHLATTGPPNGVNRITARAASLDQLAATLGSLAGSTVVVIDRAVVGGRGGGAA